MGERVGPPERLPKQAHHALVPAAVAGDDESEPTRRRQHALSERCILLRKIGGKVLDAIVAKVAVKLAVYWPLLIRQGLVGRRWAFEVEGADRPAAYLGDGALHYAVKVRREDHARQPTRQQRAHHPVSGGEPDLVLG